MREEKGEEGGEKERGWLSMRKSRRRRVGDRCKRRNGAVGE